MRTSLSPVLITAVAWALLLGRLFWRWRPLRRPDEASVREHEKPARWAAATFVLGAPGRWLRRAARRPPDPAADSRLSLWLFVALVGVALIGMAALLIVGGLVAASASVARRGRRRTAHMTAAELLDATALLALAVDAGSNVRQALSLVAPWLAGSVGSAFRLALSRSESGGVLSEEVEAALVPLGPNARGLTSALVGAERHGAPLGAALQMLGGELRAARRRSIEEAARRVPVRLLFPLICATLPAFGLLTIAPMLAGSLGLLRGGT